ncbi:DUF3618 domain-containing protein [Nonomuraea sp. NPDC050783]|uniref:DUF3618 domain-containing protein n=1 Tax=Nonomuraea sp. NPDC050783 TaxID=3154634 RepID=UPI00346686DD
MSETNPGYSEQHAGDIGAHRATVGTPTEPESVNVPATRPGAAENARREEASRKGHETFVPQPPIEDDRTDAVDSRRTEERSMEGTNRTDTPGGTSTRTGTTREGGTAPARRTTGDGDDDEDDAARRAVRRDIEETRAELGRTVSALAGKADVKARASHAAETAKERAAEAAGTAKERAAEAAGTAKEKAVEAAGTVKARAAGAAGVVVDRTAEMAGRFGEHAPDQVRAVAEEARRKPVVLVAAAAAVAALVVRRVVMRRRARQGGRLASGRAAVRRVMGSRVMGSRVMGRRGGK